MRSFSLLKFLVSTRLMAVLFIAFALAMAVGTFIESMYSTATARIFIYNARWFELMMLLFVINFVGNINRYKLWKWSKWPLLALHLSWILIILGAGVTRYISYEGMMPIAEGEASSSFYSDKTFFTAYIDGDLEGSRKRKVLEDAMIFSGEGRKSSLPWSTQFGNTPIEIKYVDFIPHAVEGVIEDPTASYILKIVESVDGARHNHFIQEGEVANIHNVLFSFNQPTPGAIELTFDGEAYGIKSPFDAQFMRMADQFQGALKAEESDALQLRSLYTIGEFGFVIPDPAIRGRVDVIEAGKDGADETKEALVLEVDVAGNSKRVTLMGGQGYTDFQPSFEWGGLTFTMRYGSKEYELPFAIKLNDFIAEKYPGTEANYASFMSRIEVQDNPSFDYDIYMNHVLDHKGYRFFQSSFFPDESGTVLSVNHDQWGTWITYIGYFLLYAGLMGLIFFGDTRFKVLAKSLKKLNQKKSALLTVLFFGFGLGAWGQENQLPSQEVVDSLILSNVVSQDHASKFASLVIQDDNGRMKPVHTFASELLRKISLKDSYKGLSAEQVFLSMMLYPGLWYNTEFIALDKKAQNDSIRSIIGVPKAKRYVKVTDFFDEEGNNKLRPYLVEAFATNTPNKFQQDFKDASNRLALLNRALSGEILRIFPVPTDENNKWTSALEYRSGVVQLNDTLYGSFVANSIPLYLQYVDGGVQEGDYQKADQLLESLKKSQRQLGFEVIPAESKIQTEIRYNRWDIFNRLYKYYSLFGVVLFFVVVARIYKERKALKMTVSLFKFFIYALFLVHTLGLGVRWYISGHAPWSDAYESILYVSWATLGIGLWLGKKSDFTIASSAFVSAMLLWIAHQNWVDPAVANLQPVLDSYWLMIHVAVIVGSYGPLTVGMILGVVTLILMLLSNSTNKERMKLSIKELTVINELSLTIGLIMLTIGNFLGGQWANESWGRYWGWDPKETWALISILVYAFVLHMRLVPGLKGRWAFNFASIVAFSSIMMTYFGVNFYLVGLHSYASGDQVITPSFIYYTAAGVLLIGILSFVKYKRIYGTA
ncbi:MAG: cytochrome c biogenesis protein CcsA [Flavobacteriaceae bacterium]